MVRRLSGVTGQASGSSQALCASTLVASMLAAIRRPWLGMS